jgi:exosortase/archaeosortase family protein
LSEARSPASALRLVRPPHAAWLGLGALALVGWREGLAFALSEGSAGSVEHMLFDAAENPPWLLAAVGAALLLSRARDVRAAVGAPGSPLLAALLLAPGLALLGWARFVDAPDLALLGTLAMGLGAAYAAAGGALLRLIALPLGLLAFALPVPGVLVNQVIYPLQMATAEYAHGLVTLIGHTTVRSADVIRTVSHTFLVIEGCSGLGSMEVLTLLALAWGWQTKAPFWRCVALAVAAPIIAFVLNGFRVVTLVLFPDNPLWSGHTVQGVVAFALGSLCIALLDRVLEGRPRAAPGVAGAGAPSARPPLALAGWLAAAVVLSLAIPRYAVPGVQTRGSLLPENAGPWKSKSLEPDRMYLGSVHFDRAERRSYFAEQPPVGTSSSGRPVFVEAFVGEDWRRTRAESLRSAKNCVPGRGWWIDEQSELPLGVGFVVERTLARSESRRLLSWTYYVGVESAPIEAFRTFFALERSPFRRESFAYAVRITTEILAEDKDDAFANRRLRALYRAIEPDLKRATAG